MRLPLERDIKGHRVMMRGNAWQLGTSDALFSLTTRAGNFILL
jgi:hypothetical protein